MAYSHAHIRRLWFVSFIFLFSYASWAWVTCVRREHEHNIYLTQLKCVNTQGVAVSIWFTVTNDDIIWVSPNLRSYLPYSGFVHFMTIHAAWCVSAGNSKWKIKLNYFFLFAGLPACLLSQRDILYTSRSSSTGLQHTCILLIIHAWQIVAHVKIDLFTSQQTLILAYAIIQNVNKSEVDRCKLLCAIILIHS